MPTCCNLLTVGALAVTLLAYAPFSASQEPSRGKIGNEGVVFGSLAIHVEKGPDNEPGLAFLKGRRADDATYEFFFNEKGPLPLFPTFTIKVRPGKEETFIRTLPAGEYLIRKVTQLGFSTLELYIRDVYFRVVPGQTTYVGKLTLLFPYRIMTGSPVRITVTDAQQEATEALRGEHAPSLARVVKELITGGGRSTGAGAGQTPAGEASKQGAPAPMAANEGDLPLAGVMLVNPESKRSVTCPEALLEPRLLTNEQAVQERAWHAEFQKTHKRLPTPMEGCIKIYEILGFVRTAPGPDKNQ